MRSEGSAEERFFRLLEIEAARHSLIRAHIGGRQRKVCRPKAGGVVQNDCTLDGVLQFADVPRPTVLFKSSVRLGFHATRGLVVFSGVALNEEVRQKRNVARPLA